jgi:hypothetical protein
MRKDQNFDIVVCGGYWLTDDTTKMYITDSFSEAEVMKILRPNCQVIYSNDILRTLETQKETIMKFKSFIMNPPYGKLHLPILQKMVETVVENGGNGVSLQPSDWTKLNEFNYNVWDKIGKNICSITTLDEKIKNKAFDGTTIRSNLSIFVLDPQGGCELSFSDVELAIIKKLRSKSSLRSAYPKTTGPYDLPLCGDCGHAKGWHMSICDMLSGNPTARLRFATEIERDNFRKSLELNAYTYLITIDGGAIPAHLPWLEDYTQEWTNERLYEYFDITEEEQTVIETTIVNTKN